VLPWRLAVHATDPQFLPHYSHLLQVAKDIPRHSLGKIDEAVVVADVDVPDVTPLEARLVGDRADDVAGLHAVGVAHFQTEGLEHNIAVVVALAASGPRTTSVTWGAWRAVALCSTGSAIAIAVGATGAIVAITLGTTAITVAIALDTTGGTVAVATSAASTTVVLVLCSTSPAIAFAVGCPSPAVAFASAAWFTAVVADSAIVGKLHWSVAVILSIQPLQSEDVAVRIVRFVDTASCARLLERTLFPAVITRIHTPIARLTTSVRRLAASIRRLC
jgi:hypothetical protein